MHDGHTLDRVGAESRPLIVIRPPGALGMNLLAHLARLPEYRDLLYTLTAHRIRVRYKQSVLGPLWALLQPLLLMLIFTAVFSVFARMPSEGLPYALFVYAGVLPWTFFSSAVMTATGSLVGHAYLVTKVAFPREMLPLSYVAAALFDLVVASVILMAMMLYYDISLTGITLTATRARSTGRSASASTGWTAQRSCRGSSSAHSTSRRPGGVDQSSSTCRWTSFQPISRLVPSASSRRP